MKLPKFLQDLSDEFKSFTLIRPAAPNVSTRSFGRAGRKAYMLVLDSSGSMGSEDYPPSRLTAAKTAARAFAEQCLKHSPQAMAGTVFFNSNATLAQPLAPVTDTSRALNRVFRSIEAEGGTVISAGLDMAHAEFLKWNEDISPTIVLLTDGESNELDNPVKTAHRLKAAGIQMDIIGIGGSPADVNEHDLKQMASVVDGQLRYWFIRDTPALIRKFEALALAKL